MANEIKDNIVRTTDGDCLRALIDIAHDPAGAPAEHLKITYAIGGDKVVSRGQFTSDPELAELLTRQGRSIRHLYLLNRANHPLVQVTRRFDGASGLFDELSLSPGQPNHNPIPPAEFASLVEVAQRRFRLAVSNDIVGLLGPDVAEHFRAREDALARLESIIDRNIEKFDQKRSELDTAHAARQAELESTYETRLHELESRVADKEKLLEAKADELNQRSKRLDDRSNTHVRRDIREKLLTAIKDVDRFKFTPETVTRRRWVLWSFAGFLIILLIPTAFLFYKQYTSATFDPWTFGQKIAFSATFIVSAGFFLKWLNNFAAKSAAEEFRLKQLQLDIDRASWLVELYFESVAAGDKSGLPAELLSRLSSNLFANEDTKHESVTAADAFASALVSSAGKARINLPGVDIELDKQGLRKLAKQSISEQ
jgi:hypothetical protein